MTWEDWIGNFCYTILAISYLVTNMWWLRMLAVVALGFEALYFFFGASEPLWVGIVWNGVFVAINVLNLYLLSREHLRNRFGKHETELHLGPFAGFSKLTFGRLLRAGGWRDVPEGTMLTREGEPVEDLMVIGHGQARVEAAGKVVATLQAGTFIGEMSLLTKGNATATVTTATPCRLFTVPKAALSELCERDAELDAALHGVLSRDLVRKLIATRQRAGLAPA